MIKICSVLDKLATVYDKRFQLTSITSPHYLAKHELAVIDKLKYSDVVRIIRLFVVLLSRERGTFMGC